MDSYFLSIVVPAYNEEKRLQQTLEFVLNHLNNCPWNTEIIVVDDGSTDRTADIALSYSQVRLLRNQGNLGKGEAVRQGVLAASGQVILMMDADYATPLSELSKFITRLAAYDIMIASRHSHGSIILQQPSLLRRCNSWLFRAATRTFLGLHFSDTQCGFKLFKADIVDELFSRPFVGRFSFDVEVLLRARRCGLKIGQVPVQWRHTLGSKVRVVDIILMYREIWLMRQRYHTKKADRLRMLKLKD
jgi:dolichyl-phosphate beta-glucosyltransferase